MSYSADSTADGALVEVLDKNRVLSVADGLRPGTEALAGLSSALLAAGCKRPFLLWCRDTQVAIARAAHMHVAVATPSRPKQPLPLEDMEAAV